MKKPAHTHRLTILFATALLAGAVGVAAHGQSPRTPVAAPETRVDADGTVHVPPVALPPSEYWSPEFRQAWVRRAVPNSKQAGTGYPLVNAPNAEWEAYNAACEARQAPVLEWQKRHYPVDIADTRLGGVRAAIVTPKGGVAPENAKRVLIQLHGGACGGLEGLTEAIPVAHYGKYRVVVVDFRQTPRYKFPASLDDVILVYQELRKQYDAKSIGMFGTSGGGLLTSQVLSRLQSENEEQPGAAGIFWTSYVKYPYPYGQFGDGLFWDLSGVPKYDNGPYLSAVANVATYLRDVPRTNTVAYPGESEAVLAKFPPTLFITGTRAVDLSAVATSHARLVDLGVDASLYLMEGGWHGASYGTNGSPEEAKVNTYISRWFSSKLEK